MMGTQEASALLFYDFDMESHVPSDHMLREIDRFLDVGTIGQQLKQRLEKLSAILEFATTADAVPHNVGKTLKAPKDTQ